VKFFLDHWYLFLMAGASGVGLLWPWVAQGGWRSGVSSAQAVQLINRNKAVLIDVRIAAEYALDHAKGAKNVPLSDLVAGARGLPKNKTLPVVVMCATGARARKAVLTLRNLGFQETHVLSGGLAAWREAQLPIEAAAKPAAARPIASAPIKSVLP
jgi:rhodanese-related sulfurtransferase